MKKKYFIILLLAVGCMSALKAQPLSVVKKETESSKEQKIIFTGGPILEMNVSNFIHSGIGDSKSKMKFGFSTGGFLNLGISKSFSVQGEMLFHYKISDFEWSSQTGEYRYWGMEIPVYAMYHYCFSKGNRLHIGIGPYTEFGLGASFKYGGIKQDLYEKDSATGLPALCDSNTGFGIKVGYEFVSGFQINATYKASVTNLLDENSSRIKMHPQTFSIGIAYRFAK